MKIDVSKSVYHEVDNVNAEFSRAELKKARVLLRRLRFLEQQVRETGGLKSGEASGGAGWAEWESDALEWALTEIGFLSEDIGVRP